MALHLEVELGKVTFSKNMKVSTFLGPNSFLFARSVSGPKKSQLSWSNPFNGPCDGFACIKNIPYWAVSIRGPKVVLCT